MTSFFYNPEEKAETFRETYSKRGHQNPYLFPKSVLEKAGIPESEWGDIRLGRRQTRTIKTCT